MSKDSLSAAQTIGAASSFLPVAEATASHDCHKNSDIAGSIPPANIWHGFRYDRDNSGFTMM
jgi:hypothetical protein